ncbi:TPA: hypothetical protein ACH3X2_000272 [Trebouxia sp. C0005]
MWCFDQGSAGIPESAHLPAHHQAINFSQAFNQALLSRHSQSTAGQRKTKNVPIVHSNNRFSASNGGLLILIIGTLTWKAAPWQQKAKPSSENDVYEQSKTGCQGRRKG